MPITLILAINNFVFRAYIPKPDDLGVHKLLKSVDGNLERMGLTDISLVWKKDPEYSYVNEQLFSEPNDVYKLTYKRGNTVKYRAISMHQLHKGAINIKREEFPLYRVAHMEISKFCSISFVAIGIYILLAISLFSLLEPIVKRIIKRKKDIATS